MDGVRTPGILGTETDTRACGSMTRSMDAACTHGKMGAVTQAHGTTISSMDTARSLGSAGTCTRVCGLTASSRGTGRRGFSSQQAIRTS